jgi:ATP-binding cassette subfamily C (CFTR/MRP) protein 1
VCVQIISAVAVPLVTPILVPLYFMFSWVRTFYVATSRDIKREEALSRSPLFTSFSSTLKGLATIRAYKCQVRAAPANPCRLPASVLGYPHPAPEPFVRSLALCTLV